MDRPRCDLHDSSSAVQAPDGRRQVLRFQTSFDVLVGKGQDFFGAALGALDKGGAETCGVN